MQELDETERAALVFECDHKWNNPAMMWYSIGLCAIEAATQGRDQTGSNGANFSFPEGFRIHNGTQRHEWLVGLINAIIFMTAGLIRGKDCSRQLVQQATLQSRALSSYPIDKLGPFSLQVQQLPSDYDRLVSPRPLRCGSRSSASTGEVPPNMSKNVTSTANMGGSLASSRLRSLMTRSSKRK
ncbi:hypothetical protein LTR22_022443 [Elasticomyces elasticus]|nr:hypothetical protein LTR22_022443 [Elasticomyces elasticus]